MSQNRTIAVVGAGFSGTLLAVQLLRRPGPNVLLIERGPVFGRGLAYGTTCAAHLLNVRSARMSAFPDDPQDFVRWLGVNRPELADPADFVPRMVYGDYLIDTLARAEAAAPGRLQRISGEVVSVDTDEAGARLSLGDGRAIEAGRVVLAFGNGAPDSPGGPGLDAAPPDRWIADPWAPGAMAAVQSNDRVLLVGTGLTMVDVALALDVQGWQGQALALSRRGLLPRPHDAVQHHPAALAPPTGSLARRVRGFRDRIDGRGWGAAMDAIRPFNQANWRAASTAERRRFLRHLRPWWDVHRHRTAFQVGARITEMQAAGALELAAGRIVDASHDADGLNVVWRARGEREPRRERFDRAINCTGPRMDLSRSAEPLHRDLFRRGAARVDPCRVGIEVDEAGQVVDADGRTNPRLLAIGPPTKGECWEVVAVPEIRGQAQRMAERLAAG